jgi:hypothetical protein
MLRTLLICTVISASVLGCATSPSPKPATATAKNAVRADCIRDTGSRLPAKAPGCQNVPGRSYSQDDIDRTGQTDAANALRMLDPAVTVHH